MPYCCIACLVVLLVTFTEQTLGSHFAPFYQKLMYDTFRVLFKIVLCFVLFFFQARSQKFPPGFGLLILLLPPSREALSHRAELVQHWGYHPRLQCAPCSALGDVIFNNPQPGRASLLFFPLAVLLIAKSV